VGYNKDFGVPTALARLRHNIFHGSGEIKKNKLGVIGLAAQQYVQ
jgi:hypothetical protein